MFDINDYLIPEIYKPLLYIAIAIIVYGIIKKIIKYLINGKQTKLDKDSYNYKKIETFKVLIQNLFKYVIMLFLVLAILTVYGVDVSSVLAGLGIVGAIVGLALQDFVKDIIAGISIIIENQYAIGDTVKIDDFRGEVIFLGLKTTRIKSLIGEVKIIPNRNVQSVINYSMEKYIALLDVPVKYEEDLNKVEYVLNQALVKLQSSLPNLKGKIEVLGVNEFAQNSLLYRIAIPVQFNDSFEYLRTARKEIKKSLEQVGITIPYPIVEVHNGK